MPSGKADGTIIIDAAIQTDGVHAGTKEIEKATRRAAKSVDDMGKSMSGYSREAMAFIENYAKSLDKASKPINEMRAELEKAKAALKELEKQGLWFGDEEFDQAAKQLVRIQQDVKDYKKELSTPAKVENPFGLDTIEGQLREAENELRRLYEAGKGLGSEEYDKQARAVAELREQYKATQAEITKTTAQREKEAAAAQAAAEKQAAAAQAAAEKKAAAEQKAAERQAAAEQRAAQTEAQKQARLDAQNAKLDLLRQKEAQAAAEAARLRAIGENAQISSPKIVKLQNELELLRHRQETLKAAGVGKLGYSEYEQNAARISEINQKLKEYEATLKESQSPLERFKQKLADIAHKATETGKGTKSAARGLADGFKKGLKSLLKYGLAIRSLGALVNNLKSYIKEGMANLAQFSGTTNSSISSMKSALTTLKNSLATAFAPILNVVAPIITKFINMISQAVSYVGMFIAALTGQSSYTRAIAVQEDYAASLGGTADAANDAADATNAASKAADDYLSGLDEINRWSSDSGGGGSGASGGGGSGGGASSNPMFETVPLEGFATDWAKMFQEAWEKADFTEIGTIVGTKLRDALNNVDWDEIKAATEKVAKSVATLMNGFFETPGLWDTVGASIGEGINTALVGVNSFLENVHTESIGSAVTTTIQSGFNQIDWSLVTSTLTNGVARGLDFVTGLIEGVDWKALPGDIVDACKEAISGIQWGEVFGSAGKLAGAAFKAALDFTTGLGELIDKAVDSIIGYFKQYIDSADTGFLGTDIIVGIFNGIVDFLKNVGSWIKENVLDPFIDGFKSTFDIHSPSKLPAILEIGENIMLGILNGIAGALSSIGTWVKDNVLTPIVNGITSAGNFFADAGKTIWNGISDAFGTVSKTVSVTVTAAKDKAFDVVSSGWDAIKSKAATLTATAKNAASGVLTTLKDGWSAIKDKSATLTGKAQNAASSIFTGLRSNWNTIKDKSATLTGKAKNAAASIFTTLRSSWNTVKTKIATLTGKATNKNSSTLKTLKDSWNTIKSKTVTLTAKLAGQALQLWKKLTGHASGGIYKNGRWQPIEGYASGGSPSSARLFYANENGMPELIGRIGSHTAVMNNSQIVASVAAGVYKAVAAAFGQLSGYFSSISTNMAQIPVAIERLATTFPQIATPAPLMSTGTILPPQIIVNVDGVDELRDAIDGLKASIANGRAASSSGQYSSQNNSYRFTAQINRRVLFDEMITEAQLRRMNTGRNPFEEI